MVEENKINKVEETKKEVKPGEKTKTIGESKVEENLVEATEKKPEENVIVKPGDVLKDTKPIEKGGGEKPEEKKDDKKHSKKKQAEVKPVVKKDEAVATGRSLHASKKQCMYICDFIKGKGIDNAIEELEEVIKMKKAVPFKGEIPHRKGKGMMSGRYPVKAAGLFINVLKGLKGNIIVNGMDLDKSVIYFGSANWAARPMRSNRRQAKRTHVVLKAKEMKPKAEGGKK
jgi:large subunit ribosomal protein L22